MVAAGFSVLLVWNLSREYPGSAYLEAGVILGAICGLLLAGAVIGVHKAVTQRAPEGRTLIIIGVIMWFLGINPFSILTGGGGGGTAGLPDFDNMPQMPNITIQLVHIQGPLKGQIQDFSEFPVHIGRHSTCQVRFEKDLTTISRRHARIDRQGNRFRIIDANEAFLEKFGLTRDQVIGQFCYRIVREIGSLAAALGGLDALVFTGGIGENSAGVRARTCENMEFLGLELDGKINEDVKGETIISGDNSKVKLLVIPTNEELVIAEDTARIIQESQ